MSVPAKRSVDLAAEIHDLEDALAAALFLVEFMAHDQFETEEQATRAPGATAAVIRLLSHRLQHLGQVLRGELDPGSLWSPANDAGERSGPAVLESWNRGR